MITRQTDAQNDGPMRLRVVKRKELVATMPKLKQNSRKASTIYV